MQYHPTFVLHACAAALLGFSATAHAAPETNGVIVKFRDTGVKTLQNFDRARLLSARVASDVQVRNGPAPNMRLVKSRDGALSDEELAAKLAQDPSVELAVPNRRKHLLAVPNDPLYTTQWHLSSALPGGIHAEGAWDITTGALHHTPVAVVDSGVRLDHPDLAGRLLPGYDFVSDHNTGEENYTADGDGPDRDPSDPGDYAPYDSDCDSNSWHGTKIAGLIAAAGNNSTGVTGIHWDGRILPVRVAGRCGAYDDDIIKGIRWAAGLDVGDPAVPTNPNPVRVINLSIGGARPTREPCTSFNSAYPELIRDLNAKGVLLVVAAGNESTKGLAEPASCMGVFAVAAVTGEGKKTDYSNWDFSVALSAPGGDGTYSNYTGLVTTTNDGTTTVGNNTYSQVSDGVAGTSFAAPIVAGVAALMLDVNPNLTLTEVKEILRSTATPFPEAPSTAWRQSCDFTESGDDTECYCTTLTCGQGIVNAQAAVAEAKRRLAPPAPTEPTEPTTPTEPTEPTAPTAPTDNTGGTSGSDNTSGGNTSGSGNTDNNASSGGGGGGAADLANLAGLFALGLASRRLRRRTV